MILVLWSMLAITRKVFSVITQNPQQCYLKICQTLWLHQSLNTCKLSQGKAILSIGAPGGSRIIYTVLGALLSVMDFKMSIKEAIDAP